ncbi:MAG: hypothetical protein ACKPB0_08900 [Opitutaceae bacterium]
MESAPASRPPALPRRVLGAVLVVTLAPVAYMLFRTAGAVRDVAYWDEIDTVLEFLLRYTAAPDAYERLKVLFSLNNEHRMATSRVLLVLSHALTGTVNLAVLGAVGVGFVVGLAGLLVATAGDAWRRALLGLLLGGLLFQLQHFENFFWAGSSLDHFQVVTLAAAVFVALARRSRTGLAVAAVAGTAATFTLAQGLLAWPVAAALLALQGRRRDLAGWSACAVFALGCFFTGFGTNLGHATTEISGAGLLRVLHFWLQALGSPVALGNATLAPFLGAALLAILATQLRPEVLAREPVALPLAIWAVGSLLLISLGRLEVVKGHVHSRYYILSCLTWGLVLFVQLGLWRDPARPARLLWRAAAGVAAFNVAANLTTAHDARSWIICRDSAMERFVEHGRDGQGPFFLHPVPAYTDLMVRRAEEAGLYRMPSISRPARLGGAKPGADIAYFIDRIPVTPEQVRIEGWAALPGIPARAGDVRVILQSAKSRLVFTAAPQPRPDVASVHTAQNWRDSGFRFQLRRSLLPKENFQIGLLLTTPRGPELVMTAHRVDLTGEGRGVLAGAP